jgi:hypothetical protein
MDEGARLANEQMDRDRQLDRLGDIAKKLDRIIDLLDSHGLTLRAPDRDEQKCPLCFGDRWLLHNDGLMHPCPECNKTGISNRPSGR